MHACDRQTDGQTDGQTDRITTPKTALAYARAVKTVEQEKNRNSQKSVKSVRLMGMGVYGGKDFWKKYVFRLE